jgi:hypothetical protein
MERETTTARLSGQVWRRILIVATMVSALVGGVVAVAGRTTASEPGVSQSRLEASPVDPSCRELIAIPDPKIHGEQAGGSTRRRVVEPGSSVVVG